MINLRDVGKTLTGRLVSALADSENLRQKAFNSIRKRDPTATRLSQEENLRFLNWVFLNTAQSSSQLFQDLWVTHETSGLRGGFFVEFGSTNGRTNSNTWLLENKFGWTGILAEPNPAWHSDLMRNRNCIIDTRCVNSTSGGVIEFSVTADPELSSISRYASMDPISVNRANALQIEVETVSLNRLLDEHDAPSVINFMSVDTEGSEYDILSNFDFGARHVQLISVEHNHSPAEGKIDTLLKQNGYKRKFPEFSQWDAWYVLAAP